MYLYHMLILRVLKTLLFIGVPLCGIRYPITSKRVEHCTLLRQNEIVYNDLMRMILCCPFFLTTWYIIYCLIFKCSLNFCMTFYDFLITFFFT